MARVKSLRVTGLEPNRTPLRERLPTHDEQGHRLCDFMMLLPGLRERDRGAFAARLAALEAVLGASDDVVFADLNTPRNLLWVSLRARHGAINELAAAISRRLPEAKLVGHPCADPAPGRGLDSARRRARTSRRRRLSWWRRGGD